MNNLLKAIEKNSTIIILILAILIIVYFIINFLMYLRIRKLETRYKAFMKGKNGQSLERIFVQRFKELERLGAAKEIHERKITELQDKYTRLYSKYGVEKYDAFDDVGGKMSFVLALLDKNNTGVILNAIHSRDNCFLYLKEIVKGESFVMLSEEEVEALKKAVNFGLAENIEKQIANNSKAEKKENLS